MIVARRAAVLAVALILAGCGSTAPPSPTAFSPTATGSLAASLPPSAQAAVSPSPAGTVAPTTSPTPTQPATPAPTPTPAPPVLDGAAFLKVFDSTAALKQYPAVSGAKVGSLYAAAIKAEPALANVLGKLPAYANPAKSASTLLICAGQAPNPNGVTFSQVEDYQMACVAALPRLIWYINHNRDAKALPLLRALVGYILRQGVPLMGTPWSDTSSQGWRAWMVAEMWPAEYLDGQCGAPAPTC